MWKNPHLPDIADPIRQSQESQILFAFRKLPLALSRVRDDTIRPYANQQIWYSIILNLGKTTYQSMSIFWQAR